jgi:flagellar hook assembly protein FlgD
VTTIQFSVETNSKTSLQIFDITGRLVETLVNENLEPGYHEITWNATNVSSGVYIYKLTTDAGQLTRKMILLK